jgi:cytoskeletal protein CcmA (bactofilin family)
VASQSPFFGRRDREPEPLTSRPAPLMGSGTNLSGASVGTAGASAATTAVPPMVSNTVSAPKEGGAKLTVGPNIKLKGVEITDCDTLVVEGLVEATMDSRVMQIAETGAFKGSAGIDIAEIRGVFDGNLTVREKLVIHATGKVSGKIRYGKVVIEEGGQLSGEITVGAASSSSESSKSDDKASSSKPALQAAA